MALEAALVAAGNSVYTEWYHLDRLLHEAQREPSKADPCLGGFFDVLGNEEPLKIFDGLMQVVANGARRVDFKDLAAWMLRRASKVGSVQTVADLERYVKSTEIPHLAVLALSGIKVTTPCDFEGGMSLVPWDDLPESRGKGRINEMFSSSLSWKSPSAALVREHQLPKLHIPAEEIDSHFKAIDQSDMIDAVLCIGVIGPTAPEVLASWTQPPIWAPILAGSIGVAHYEGIGRKDPWPDSSCGEAVEIFQAFRGLGHKQQTVLRLAMQRLNLAMRRTSLVDRAIDLGIALETLFLGDIGNERGELAFRLCIRAARYMGNDEEDRERIYLLVRDLYDLRSRAVHTGVVPTTTRNKTTDEVLNQGFSLTARTIAALARDGAPDWKNVILQ